MNWKYKIELNKVLSQMNDKYNLSRLEEKCPTEVKEALAEEVSKAFPLAHFGAKFKKAKSIAAVNRLLQEVFNTADRNAVWCGL